MGASANHRKLSADSDPGRDRRRSGLLTGDIPIMRCSDATETDVRQEHAQVARD
jgi:hypothetical protein